MLIATIGVAFMPKEELGLSLPIMPLEDWVSQVQTRFHAFYANGIGINVSMLPETIGLFLLGLYAGKRHFPSHERVRPETKKWQIIMFVLTLPFWFLMVRYFLSTSSYEPLYMQGLAMFSGKTLFIFYIFTLMRLLQKKMANVITSVPVRWANGINKLHFTYNCYVTCIRTTVQNGYLAPLWVGPLFCIGFYTLQIFISRWWLSRYQYGPLEYIWRLGTYGKMMPLKRKARSHNSNESVLK